MDAPHLVKALRNGTLRKEEFGRAADVIEAWEGVTWQRRPAEKEKGIAMTSAWEIVDLLPERRIERLRDQEDINDLSALLAQAFGVGDLQADISDALSSRVMEVKRDRT